MALTSKDFSKIRDLVIDVLDEKLNAYPSRGEFDKKFDKVYNALDKVMGELETIRDEVTLSASRVSVEELEERVVKIEQQVATS